MDAVQKVSAVYESGRSRAQMSGVAFGMAGSNDISYAILKGTQQTELSRLLAPPRKPAHPGGLVVTLALILVACLLLGCVLPTLLQLLLSIAKQPHSTWQGPDMVLLLVIGGLSLLGILLAVRSELKKVPLRHAREQAELTNWQKAIVRWRQLSYCHRCGGVFSPGQARLVNPHALNVVLFQP